MSRHGGASLSAVHATRKRIKRGDADATGEASGFIMEFRVKKIHFTVVTAPPWMTVMSRSTWITTIRRE
jgi:hypothetical protein